MIGCVLLERPGEAALLALRLRLDRISPRVQLRVAPTEVELLADLGRGTAREGRARAEGLAATAAAEALREARVGVAATPTLAALAARRAAPGGTLVAGPAGAGELLARCPVGWHPALAPLAPTLHGLGLRSLADIAALPAAAVGGRFGAAALAAWRALHGDEPPLVAAPQPPRLGARRRFAGAVADQGALALALARLAARLGAELERRGAQARALALHLHGDGGPWSAGRVLERPAASPAALAPVATGLLAAAGATAGVEGVTLIVGELTPARGEQLQLFAPAADRRAEAAAALADLAARLGPGALLRPALEPAGAALAEERGRLHPWCTR